MTAFLRLLAEDDKAAALQQVCARLRRGETDARLFEVAPEAFDAVPGKPFAYWVSDAVRNSFMKFPAVEKNTLVTSGTGTLDDFRFLRCWWEIKGSERWFPFAKGGAFSPTYYDHHLLVNWTVDGSEMKAWIIFRYGGGHWARNIRSTEHYFRPGLTWPRRTTSGLSMRVMPAGCIFADKGPAAFVAGDDPGELLALCALLNSSAFGLLVSLQTAAADAAARSYEVGLIQQTPVPNLTAENQTRLATLARRAWSLKRTLDTIEETSHAFLLPAALRARLGDFNPPAIEAELAHIQAEIDAIAFDLYGFSESDRAAVLAAQGAAAEEAGQAEADDEPDDEDIAAPIDLSDGLLSWAVGVAFGRFDWRLATGEREVPPEPEPFDPLPAKSPGMLPDGAEPFHAHAGILVDDPGHPHDLPRLIEEVLTRVDVAVPDEARRWLRRDFFAFHLRQYSKSRRKAPIYWPLATASGSYTLWVYYPSLTSQTLYTAINDFVEPKLKQVSSEVAALRSKGAARTRDDEKQFEALQAFELELIELRDTLLEIAPTYKPHHDDGVQISAAPLWPLFRHKPWQKVLKETWKKLEKGDYDWAHLAMNYWPERVHEKCKTDKSLAIAHGLEHLYIEPAAKPKKARGRKAKDD
ncbi:type II restriction endonuclease subunit M [Tepidiphilus sp. J10]|uniref:type II restriction endonuclease subunit M n=1 Tax=Tepidiphilus sp. J10 TaxID=2502185 RepID=UPI00115D5467|nr:type II restriction endonuclease subunit M [Tepidiphilus sp. J10]